MKMHTWTRAALAGAGILAVTAGAALAQSEMTDKIRLECADSSTACTGASAGAQYDISISGTTEGSFGVRKTTSGNDAIHINGTDGRIGINTNNPLATLHIFGPNNQDIFNGIGPDPTSAGTAMNYGYAGASFGIGGGFFNVRPAPGSVAPNPSLRFMSANLVRISIDNNGDIGFGINAFPGNVDPTFPLQHMPSGAHLTVGGVWTDASSRDLKENIVDLSGSEATEALNNLQPVKFDYKAEPAEARVGFIAEDVPALVADNNRKSLAPMDIVGVLTKVVQDQQKAIAELRAELDALKQQQQ